MAVAGVEAQILDALLWYVGQVATQIGLPIAFPNVPFTPTLGSAYLTAAFRPNITNALGIDFGGTVDRQGLFQVSVFSPAGAGAIGSTQTAAQIAQAFKNGTQIYRNGVLVRMDQAPRLAPSLQETDWLQTPVMIPWRCFVEVN